MNSAAYKDRNKLYGSALRRLVNNWRAKYTFGSAQTNPPNNADKACSCLTANKLPAMQKVSSHCAASMRFICSGIVSFRTKIYVFCMIGSALQQISSCNGHKYAFHFCPAMGFDHHLLQDARAV